MLTGRPSRRVINGGNPSSRARARPRVGVPAAVSSAPERHRAGRVREPVQERCSQFPPAPVPAKGDQERSAVRRPVVRTGSTVLPAWLRSQRRFSKRAAFVSPESTTGRGWTGSWSSSPKPTRSKAAHPTRSSSRSPTLRTSSHRRDDVGWSCERGPAPTASGLGASHELVAPPATLLIVPGRACRRSSHRARSSNSASTFTSSDCSAEALATAVLDKAGSLLLGGSVRTLTDGQPASAPRHRVNPRRRAAGGRASTTKQRRGELDRQPVPRTVHARRSGGGRAVGSACFGPGKFHPPPRTCPAVVTAPEQRTSR